MKIAVVIPTIRPKMIPFFLKKWEYQFDQYDVEVVLVYDGDEPKVQHKGKEFSVKDVMEKYDDLIFNKNDGVRNLGFAFVAKYMKETGCILSLDDDVAPYEDTIGDHLKALQMRVPISWMSTASEYMRGFPYSIRDEASVVLSHGVWEGIKDYDAPTQLARGNPDATFYKGVIPKGIYFPMCAMNLAFKTQLLPYVYQAPMGPSVGLHRFADIWGGIYAKREIDSIGWAAVSGYSKVAHEKASLVYDNLIKEAKGIKLNESFWRGDESDPYFKIYEEKREKWEDFILSLFE